MSTPEDIAALNLCVIIPTYNNENTLERVLLNVLEVVPAHRIIVVNDGSTDGTSTILQKYSPQLTVLNNTVNSGKGYALRKGFEHALAAGYSHALTIDSDGQHYPEEIPLLTTAAMEHPGAVIMGSRNMDQEGVPQKSSFGNRFSNFWFKVETWITLPDTQTGFRIYPLNRMKEMRLFTTKFELEIEVIVRLAWKGVVFVPVPIQVKYDPNERVSHFRPGRDFFRISVLNSVLVTIALFFYYPRKFFSFHMLRAVKDEAIKSEESNFRKALALSFGIFMGIFPIWGFQLLVGIPLAVLFRLNKVLFIAAANISIPPMIPVILYASLMTGQFFVEGKMDHTQLLSLDSNALTENFYQYIIGAVVLAILSSMLMFIISYVLFNLFRPAGRIKPRTPRRP